MNPWEYKPWWCQPWSILLTGIIVIVSSWQLGQKIWLTLGVSLLILSWWYYFLIIWPKLLQEYYHSQSAETEKNKTSS